MDVTRSDRHSMSYLRISSRPLRSSSAGGMPSRDRKPCSAWDVRFRGAPASQMTVRRRARPSSRAALNPAGPPPTMMTSSIRTGVASSPPRTSRRPVLLLPGCEVGEPVTSSAHRLRRPACSSCHLAKARRAATPANLEAKRLQVSRLEIPGTGPRPAGRGLAAFRSARLSLFTPGRSNRGRPSPNVSGATSRNPQRHPFEVWPRRENARFFTEADASPVLYGRVRAADINPRERSMNTRTQLFPSSLSHIGRPSGAGEHSSVFLA